MSSRTSPPQLLLSPSISSSGWADEILAAATRRGSSTPGPTHPHSHGGRASRYPNETRPFTAPFALDNSAGYASASLGPHSREPGAWGVQSEREKEQRRAQVKRSASQPSLTPLVIAPSPSSPPKPHIPYPPPPALLNHHSSANLQAHAHAPPANRFPGIGDAVRNGNGNGNGHAHYPSGAGSVVEGSLGSSPSRMSKKRGFLGKVKGAFGSVGRFGRRERSESGGSVRS